MNVSIMKPVRTLQRLVLIIVCMSAIQISYGQETRCPEENDNPKEGYDEKEKDLQHTVDSKVCGRTCKAVNWYRKSARAGDETAKKNLQILGETW